MSRTANRRVSFGGNLLAPNLENEEVIEKKLTFERGLKIAADNKINGNNTWDLALIDYFADMTLLRDGEGINFQKASYTLDGCVKVYTSRIDSFEMETRKLLLGLADKNSGNPPGDDDNQAGVAEDGSKQNKRRKQLATTLEDNSALTTDALELDFAADPLFQKTAADFDEGGAKGLLLSHLDISKTGKIIFDASDVAASKDMPPTLPTSSDIDMVSLIAKFGSKFSNLESREICPTFSSFLFNSDTVQDFNLESINREDFYFNEVEDEVSDYEDLPNEMYLVGPNQENLFIPPVPQSDDFQDDYYDDGPGPMDEGDMGDADMAPLTTEGGATTDRVAMVQQQHAVNGMVQESGFMADENAFRFFDTLPGRNWAGPQFWKSRSLKATDPAVGSKTTRAPAKKKDKVAIDFINGPRLDRAKVFAKSSTSTTIPKSKAKSLNQELHLLPDDLQFNSERLLKLFLKPRFKIRQVMESIMSYKAPGEPAIEATQPVEEGEEFVYGGFEDVDDDVPDDLPSTLPAGFGILPGDSVQEPLAEPNLAFNHDFNDDYGDMGDFSMPNESQIESLPAASQAPGDAANTSHVSGSMSMKKEGQDMKPKFKQKTIPLFFARTAKRVDVAKLKENLWQKMVEPEIKEEAEEEDKENASPRKNLKTDTEHHELDKSNMFHDPKQFTHIVSELDECYGEKARKDISVAFCFICVLHLANENNLKITSEGMKELVITANS